MRSILGVLVALVIAGPASAGSLADWAVVVAAGDDHAAHEDVRTEAFDNARRDVSDLLVRRGVARANLAQFSVRPGPGRGSSTPADIFGKLRALAKTAPGGCLVYLTSHGSPDGVLIGDTILTPTRLARLVTGACGARPTAVVLSACFSGSSLPALRGPDRFILTAARRDRSSFGCSEDDKYPYFDGCMVAALPRAQGFVDLAATVRACVARREDEEGLRPRSEPQLWIGRDFRHNAPIFVPDLRSKP